MQIGLAPPPLNCSKHETIAYMDNDWYNYVLLADNYSEYCNIR